MFVTEAGTAEISNSGNKQNANAKGLFCFCTDSSWEIFPYVPCSVYFTHEKSHL